MSEKKLTKLKERKDFFTNEDVSNEKDYTGKILVLSETKMGDFKEKYNNPQNQLVIAKSGFGCNSGKIGTAVISKFILDDEVSRLERYDFIGVLKNSVANEVGLCPCGNELHEELVMNSLSREDNKTYICKKCEGKELQKELEKLDLL